MSFSPQNDNFVIILSPLCRSKPVGLLYSLFFHTMEIKVFLDPSFKNNSLKYLFCLSQKKKNAGFEQHDGKTTIIKPFLG